MRIPEIFGKPVVPSATIDSMTQQFQARIPAKFPIWGLIWFVLLTSLLLFPVGYVLLLKVTGDQNFWFVQRPPVPPFAVHVQKLGGGSLPGSRIITFETDQPAEKIREFYQAELSRRGWSHLCSPTQIDRMDCPLGLSQGGELADAYQRDDNSSLFQAIDITVYQPAVNQTGKVTRKVEVIEYRYPVQDP